MEKIYKIKVVPRAKEDKLMRLGEDELKIWLIAPPVDNKANFALIDFLAKNLKVKRGQISLIRGVNSRDKVVKIVF